MSSTKASLSDDDTVAQIFISLEAETTALLEPLCLSFFTDYSVFAPSNQWRTRIHKPPELLKGVLHCFCRDIYGPRPMEGDTQNKRMQDIPHS